jgi:AraC family transcriptional regulator
MCTHATTVKLTRYSPGLRQAPHSHDAPHISLVLAGGFEERAGRMEVTFDAGRLALRPEGLRHAGAFSPEGALILSCVFPAHAEAIATPHWSHPLPRGRVAKLVPLLLEAEEEAGWDLIALAQDAPPRTAASPWLADVRDRLIEEPSSASLTEIAAQSGRHRVHLGRAFLAAYGETPSVFRRRAMLNRALCAMARGLSAAASAAEGGFADQSHFARACRENYGLAPGPLLRRARDVASVQDTSP